MARRKKTLKNIDKYLIRKSKEEDATCAQAVLSVIQRLENDPKFPGLKIFNVHRLYNKVIVEKLKRKYPNVPFGQPKDSTYIMPDGGVTYITDLKEENIYPILIVEMKSQGTNDELEEKGLSPQARGNAIERLGKNVICFRTFLMDEGIMPFVCFGDGCDFDQSSNSTIPDRVLTISMYGKLNEDQLFNKGAFNRGSFFFRNNTWTKEEIEEKAYNIAKRSIYYYILKYGEDNFIKKDSNAVSNT